jgi:hypothetical protein
MSIHGIYQLLFDAAKLCDGVERDETRRALDDLFVLARKYTTTRSYTGLLRFMRRFQFYSIQCDADSCTDAWCKVRGTSTSLAQELSAAH